MAIKTTLNSHVLCSERFFCFTISIQMYLPLSRWVAFSLLQYFNHSSAWNETNTLKQWKNTYRMRHSLLYERKNAIETSALSTQLMHCHSIVCDCVTACKWVCMSVYECLLASQWESSEQAARTHQYTNTNTKHDIQKPNQYTKQPPAASLSVHTHWNGKRCDRQSI